MSPIGSQFWSPPYPDWSWISKWKGNLMKQTEHSLRWFFESSTSLVGSSTEVFSEVVWGQECWLCSFPTLQYNADILLLLMVRSFIWCTKRKILVWLDFWLISCAPVQLFITLWEAVFACFVCLRCFSEQIFSNEFCVKITRSKSELYIL